MKRYLIASFLLLWSFRANAQLKGTYCRGVTFSSTCLTFLNATEFEYDFSDCTSHSAGKGTYKLNRKSLTLTFTEPKPADPNCTVIVSEAASQSDSVTFTIQLNDQKNAVPIPFANPVLLGKDGKVIAWGTTNESGHCTFSALRSTAPAFLKVSYILYQDCLLPVTPDRNVAITIALPPQAAEWIEPGKTWTWKLKSLKENKLIFKGETDLILTKEN